MNEIYTLPISPKKTLRILLYIILFLGIAHITGLFLNFSLGLGKFHGLVPLIDMDVENSIPTIFTFLLFLVASLTFFLIWKNEGVYEKGKWMWLFFLIIFMALAIDESCSIHELFGRPFHRMFSTSGLLYRAWVIPYGLAVIALAAIVFPFWLRLEKKIRFLYALAAIIYLFGVLGMEMVGGLYFEKTAEVQSFVYGLFILFEETFEMAGLIILIYSNLIILAADQEVILIKFSKH